MYRRAAILLLLFVFSVNVFRAWTQSITTDEAFAESLFLNGHPFRLFNSYDASHHVLHTLLSKLSVTVFGLSEFSLRIPSLFGGLFYLITVYRIARHVFGEGRQFLLAVSLASLNPLMLDFMSAARGYGLAVALFLWSLYQMLVYTAGDQDISRIYRAGLGLGLSVAANLTLLVPGTALAILFILLLAGTRRFAAALESFVVPGIVTCFVIVILPLTKAARDSFYVGETSARASIKTLAALSLFHHPLDRRLAMLLPQPDFWFALVTFVLVPVVLSATGVACVVILWRWAWRRDLTQSGGPSRFLLLGGGSLLLAIGILVVLHATLKVLYPYGRTGLYLIPLFSLTALALPASLGKHHTAFVLTGRPLWVVAVACVAVYLAQFQTRYYGEWLYDASTKDVVNLIRDRHRERSPAVVRTGITWELEPGMNFYRRIYKLTWMAPLDRKGADGNYDYYVLLDRDVPLIEKRGLRVLYSDRVAGVYLAEPVDAGSP